MQLFEQDVAANGLRLHVYRTGTDKPPLVFAHGITDNGLCFLPIAEQLAEDFEIVLYDARGHGRSDPSPPGTTPLDRARDLGGLVEALALHKPGLLGHSMGGATVALFAGLSPHVPGYIILEDPQPFETLASAGDQAPEMRALWRERTAADKRKSIDELVQISRLRDPTWPEVRAAPLGAGQAAGEPYGVRGRVHGRCRIGRTDRVPDRLPDSADHGRSGTGLVVLRRGGRGSGRQSAARPAMSASPAPVTTSVASSPVYTWKQCAVF